LNTGLRRDPPGSLSALPGFVAAMGPTSKGEGKRRVRENKAGEAKRREGGRGGEGLVASHTILGPGLNFSVFLNE